MKKQANLELQAAVLPAGTLQLEWEAAGPVAAGRWRSDGRARSWQEHLYQQYRDDPEGWLLDLGLGDPELELPPSLAFWRRLAALFVARLRLIPELEALGRESGPAAEPAAEPVIEVAVENDALLDLLAEAPPLPGAEYLGLTVLQKQWRQLERAFSRRIGAFAGTVEEFFQAHRRDIHLAGRIYFHLVENRRGESPFAFMATYSARPERRDKGRQSPRHLPLQHALSEYAADQEQLLELLVTVQRAAGASKLVREMLESGEIFHPLAWSAAEAHTFLREIPLYEEAGIICRIPDWWRARRQTSLTLKVGLGEREPARLGLNAILDFTPRLLLGDSEISAEEARRLLAEAEGLTLLKGRWVEVDHERLRHTLAAYERIEKRAADGVTLFDALRLQLQPESWAGKGAGAAGDRPGQPEEIEIFEHGQWLRELRAKLQNPAPLARQTTDRRFRATLRPYQSAGLNWLRHHHQLGFGACLADDMGLGKTLQVLALLNLLTAEQGQTAKASLLIVPASLLANWANEIEKFFPALRVLIAHPDFHRPRAVPHPTAEELERLDLVITTYTLGQKYGWLKEYHWRLLVLDEAQAIKNPATGQTRAVKKIAADQRLALTGTPIENRLGDLWSLFDFLNPGLLGSPKEFAALSKKMAANSGGYGHLRQLIAPFILRRMKSDRSIISDLPDKVEMKSWAELSKKQVVLYRGLLAELEENLAAAEGIQRRGLILAALSKFKQLCNHPDHYLGNGGGFAEPESGKFARLREICETIAAKREKVLIFTQFRELTEPLSHFLAAIFGRPGLLLHGGTAVGKRRQLVESFQNENDYIPFMVLSLKAGGVGLNLTEANHVIHFDRWWNPAVENQATDRAFRIGQRRKVLVHKLITRGTIEEKIDAMLTEKAKLAAEIIPDSGEKWLTELPTTELLELFSLQR
ncbi:MAG: DEAD/DEAH box helicase [Desulfurivibrio sp.]